MEIDKAKQLLSKKGPSGVSVMDHLSSIVRYVIETTNFDDSGTVLDSFENISLQVKKERLPRTGNGRAETETEDGDENDDDEGERESILKRENEETRNFCESQLQFYGKPPPKPVKEAREADEDEDDNEVDEDEEDGDAENEEAIPFNELLSKFPDIKGSAQLWSSVGIAISPYELHALQMSVWSWLKATKKIESCRIFGKISGINADYWILECTEGETDEDDDENDENGNGDDGDESNTNYKEKYVYFVKSIGNGSNLNDGDWHDLPRLSTSDQIEKTLSMRHLFTGNLNEGPITHVDSFYDWTESVFLRAQIERIQGMTMIAPNGFYKNANEDEDDEDGGDDENEDGSGNNGDLAVNDEFDANEFHPKEHESWVHIRRINGPPPASSTKGTKKSKETDKLTKKELYGDDFSESENEDEDGGEGDDGDDEDDEENEADDDGDENGDDSNSNDSQPAILSTITGDSNKLFISKTMGGEEEEDESVSNVWNTRTFNKDTPYQVICHENRLWPGSKTIYDCKSKKFESVYFGNGLIYDGCWGGPKGPDPVQSEKFDAKLIPPVQIEIMPPPPPPPEEKTEGDENNKEEDDGEGGESEEEESGSDEE